MQQSGSAHDDEHYSGTETRAYLLLFSYSTSIFVDFGDKKIQAMKMRAAAMRDITAVV